VVVAIVVVAVVLVVLVVWALVRRDPSPHNDHADSDLRDAFVGILMTVGPFFGVRYKPPRVEIPVAATPAADDIDPATAPPRPGDEEKDPPVV
jgi:hypothetical protein